MRSPLPLILIASAATTGALVFGDVDSPIRPVVAMWFLLVCPGMALVPLLRLQDGITELVLGIGVSVALTALVAIGCLYAGFWSPNGILALLIGETLIGAMAQLLAPGGGRPAAAAGLPQAAAQPFAANTPRGHIERGDAAANASRALRTDGRATRPGSGEPRAEPRLRGRWPRRRR